MRIAAITHVSYEDIGYIRDWIKDNDHTLIEIRLWDHDTLPAPEDFDMLIIMGGPMGVHEDHKFPWLKLEKQLIKTALEKRKKILGICLGSQILAQCLGAAVYKNREPEIGWYPVHKEFFMHSWFPSFDDIESLNFFHWHGDTWDLPEDAVRLFSSEACNNQGFLYSDHAMGLQFHPEVRKEDIALLSSRAASDLDQKGNFIASGRQMIEDFDLYGESSRFFLIELLDSFTGN